MTVRFRDEALQDLEEIAGYIARDNSTAANLNFLLFRKSIH